MRLFRKRCDRCRENALFQVFDLALLEPRSVCLRHMQELIFTIKHGGWLTFRKIAKAEQD
jgi:hypothetical protein